MANYHLHTKPISRGSGRSAVAAAAYRRATVMKDERTDITHYYDKKKGVVHSELMFPEHAPAWTYAFRDAGHADSKQLWNMIERLEKRDNARLAREVEFSLPVELSQEQNIKLAQDFIKSSFVERGMVADWSMHMDNPDNPHVHVMLTMRELTEEGFGPKKKAVIDAETGAPKRGKRGEIVYERGDRWGSNELLLAWRREWANMQNEYLKAFGHDISVDHRSYADRGIELEPTMKLGMGGAGLLERGKESRIGDERVAVQMRNRDAIITDPAKIIAVIAEQKAVFTTSDIDEALSRFIKSEAERDKAVRQAIESEEVIELAEKNDEYFFTTSSMLETEKHMIDTAKGLSEISSFAVKARHVERAIDRFNQQLLQATDGKARLSEEQISSIQHVTSGEQLSVVVGMAGAGKTTIMEAAKEAWEAGGYRVRGAALSGIAASNLAESGIASSTLHSLLMHGQYAARMLDENEGRALSVKQRDYLKSHLLGAKDIIVLDEAAMVGARQMDQLLSLAQQSGSKVVLVGDHEQLQSIEAGAAFRTILERLGKSELSEIRRQKVDWMRAASQDFAKERTHKALGAYEEKGHITHLRSYEVKPEPPKVADASILSAAGMGEADIERVMLVREYLSNHSHASKIVQAAKEADIALQEHEEFDYYEFYADRRNEIAAQLLEDHKASYRVLAHHKVNMQQVAIHAQLHDGVWMKQARQRAAVIVAEKLNPEHLTHAQRIFSDDIVEGIKKGLGTPEIELNGQARSFIADMAKQAGLSEEEQAHYTRVAEYHEMRVRAGEIWHEANDDGIDLVDHEAFPEFCQVKARRDALALDIHDQFADHYAYLRHYDISMEELAADYLVAKDVSREAAISESESHANLFLNPETIAPDRRELKPEVADALPNMAIASAMVHRQLVDDYMASYVQDAERSRIVLAYTRKDVAALNEAIRAQMIEKGVVGQQSQDVTLIAQDNDGEYEETGTFAPGDRIMFRSNDKELGVMNGALGRVEAIEGDQFRVQLDNGEEVSFDVREYNRFQHGYASTVHKTQGVTVDESYVLASKHFDRHSTYVAMTRHKHDVKLYAAANQFRTMDKMKRDLSKSGANLSTLDFTEQAGRRVEEKQQRLNGGGQRLIHAYTRMKDRWQRDSKAKNILQEAGDMSQSKQSSKQAASGEVPDSGAVDPVEKVVQEMVRQTTARAEAAQKQPSNVTIWADAAVSSLTAATQTQKEREQRIHAYSAAMRLINKVSQAEKSHQEFASVHPQIDTMQTHLRQLVEGREPALKEKAEKNVKNFAQLAEQARRAEQKAARDVRVKEQKRYAALPEQEDNVVKQQSLSSSSVDVAQQKGQQKGAGDDLDVDM